MNHCEGPDIGLDLGSTAAKMVVMDNGKVTEKYVVPSHKWKELLDKIPPVCSTYSTGYFRSSVVAKRSCTEITAAMYGAEHLLDGKTMDVLIDVGGQDTKVIDNRKTDFKLNDKCSAGTGAFLEFIAQYLGVKVEDLGTLHHKAAGGSVNINSTCSVFALSEIVSHLVEEQELEVVIAGVHHAFASKISRMIPDDVESVGLLGGPALNSGVVDALEQVLDCEVAVVEPPQFVNAVGAVIYGVTD